MPRVNGTPDAHCRPARPPRPRSGPDRQVLRAEPVFDTVQRRVRRSLGRLHLQHLAEALDRRGEDQIHIGQNVLVHSAGAIEPRSGQGAGPAQRHRLRAVSDRDQLSVSTAGGEREVHGSRLRADRTVGLFHQRCVGFHPATALGGDPYWRNRLFQREMSPRRGSRTPSPARFAPPRLPHAHPMRSPPSTPVRPIPSQRHQPLRERPLPARSEQVPNPSPWP